jgi:hypothetical protein
MNRIDEITKTLADHKAALKDEFGIKKSVKTKNR